MFKSKRGTRGTVFFKIVHIYNDPDTRKPQILQQLQQIFDGVYDQLEIEVEGQKILMNHYPLVTGHIGSRFRYKIRNLNIGPRNNVRKNKKSADCQRFFVVDRGIEPLCQD